MAFEFPVLSRVQQSSFAFFSPTKRPSTTAKFFSLSSHPCRAKPRAPSISSSHFVFLNDFDKIYPKPSLLCTFRTSKRRSFSATTTMPEFPYVIVGGGNASGYVVRTLVENGVAGSDICLVGSEEKHPYERPALTKAYLHAPGSKVRARLPGFHTCVGGGGERQTPEWYGEKGVTVKLGTKVTALDSGKKCVSTSSNEEITAQKALFVATGCNPRIFDMYKGSNVSLVRNEADCAALVSSMEGGKDLKLVVVGGGYIGLEVTAAAVGWGENLASVTILNMDPMCLQRIFWDAPEFSKMLQASVESESHPVKCTVKNGIKISNVVKSADGKITAIETEDGASYPCDLVVLGLGATPATEFMPKESLSSRGYINVDSSLKFADGCFALGDCCSFPLQGEETVFEHVFHARASAKHAALTALGQTADAYSPMSFFYSRMFEYSDKPLIWNMWGTRTSNAAPHLEKKDNGFTCVWVEGGKCVSACIMMQNPAPTQEQLDACKALIGQPYPAAARTKL
ncbi:unnamed protein product [Amoebophrya sp. A120]|nr:unnamed protein product [Amoebophrya sp. A120]|eukprot:GSA120T00003325001.1